MREHYLKTAAYNISHVDADEIITFPCSMLASVVLTFQATRGAEAWRITSRLNGGHVASAAGTLKRSLPNPLRLTAETSEGKWQVWFAHAACFKDKLIDPPDADRRWPAIKADKDLWSHSV